MIHLKRLVYLLTVIMIMSNSLVLAMDNSNNEVTNKKEIIRFLETADKVKDEIKFGYSNKTTDIEGLEYIFISGKFSSFDQVMRIFGKYFAEDAAKFELKKRYLRVVDNKLAELSDFGGEGGWYIDEQSKFTFLYISTEKIFIKVRMINEYHAERDFFYTLRKQNGHWIIDDEVDQSIMLEVDDNWLAIRASSLLDEKNISHWPLNVMDHDPNTAWVEGKQDAGVGEWIDFAFGKEAKIKAINIINGYAKSNNRYFDNNRVKKVKIQFSDGTSMVKELQDVMLEPQRVEWPEEKTVDRVRLTILEVYPGAKYNDTCISEIGFE